jgi:hypothetical protein
MDIRLTLQPGSHGIIRPSEYRANVLHYVSDNGIGSWAGTRGYVSAARTPGRTENLKAVALWVRSAPLVRRTREGFGGSAGFWLGAPVAVLHRAKRNSRPECSLAWTAAVTASCLLLGGKRRIPRSLTLPRFLLAAARRAATPSTRWERSLLVPGSGLGVRAARACTGSARPACSRTPRRLALAEPRATVAFSCLARSTRWSAITTGRGWFRGHAAGHANEYPPPGSNWAPGKGAK